jgi:hypothetical protein
MNVTSACINYPPTITDVQKHLFRVLNYRNLFNKEWVIEFTRAIWLIRQKPHDI